MAKYGLTTYELELNMAGLLKDVHQTAEQEDTLKSISILEEVMDCNDLRMSLPHSQYIFSNFLLPDKVMVSPKEELSLVQRLVPTIKLEEVNELARRVFLPFFEPYAPEFIREIMGEEGSSIEGDKEAQERVDKFRWGGFKGDRSELSLFLTAPSSVYEGEEQQPLAATNNKTHRQRKGEDDEEDDESDEGDEEEEDEEDGTGDDDDEDEDEDEEEESSVHKKKQSIFIPSHGQAVHSSRLLAENPEEDTEGLREGGGGGGGGESAGEEDISEEKRPKKAFTITREEIVEVIQQATRGVKPPQNVIIPEDLVTDEDIAKKLDDLKPSWVPVKTSHLFRTKAHPVPSSSTTEKESEPKGGDDTTAPQDNTSSNPHRFVHSPSNIVLLELSNGIRVNYLHTTFRKRQCRLV